MSENYNLILDFQNQWATLRGLLKTWQFSRVQKANAMGYSVSHYTPWISEAKWISKSINAHQIDNNNLIEGNTAFIRSLTDAYRTSTDKPLGHLNQRKSSYLYKPMTCPSESTLLTYKMAHGLLLESSFRPLYKDFVKKIIPLEDPGSQKSTGVGFSTIRALGAVFLSLPNVEKELRPYDLAINLAHELGHQCLFLLQLGDQLVDPNFKEEIFSSIRNEYRPPLMALHALVALTFISTMIDELLKRRSLSAFQKNFIEKRRELYQDLYHTATVEFIGCPMTPLGQGLVNEIFKHSLAV